MRGVSERGASLREAREMREAMGRAERRWVSERVASERANEREATGKMREVKRAAGGEGRGVSEKAAIEQACAGLAPLAGGMYRDRVSLSSVCVWPRGPLLRQACLELARPLGKGKCPQF